MTDETVERFCNRRLSRGIRQQLRRVIGKIVTRRAMYGPIVPQSFRARENFFRHQIDRTAVARQSDLQRFRGALLKFDEIFAR